MKREKLVESYGRRFSTNNKIAGFLLIIAFGILMTFVQPGQESVNYRSGVEQLAK
jgi:hypothetical protein